MPWKVLVTEEEKNRFEAEEWIRQRFAAHGVEMEKVGEALYRLPALERNRRMECIFLDEDGLCSQVKRHGREFWSRTCKTFPFDFIETADGEVQVSLSHHCPAIRDNYGQPLEAQLNGYFTDSGSKSSRIAETMQLGGMTQLRREQYLRLVTLWREQLAAAPSLPQGLLTSYDFTQALAVVLMDKSEPSDAEFTAAVEQVQRDFKSEPLPQQPPTFLARLLLSISLSRLSHPLWTYAHQPQRNKLRSAYMAYRNTIRLLKGRGEIDLLLLPKAFELEQAAAITPVLSNPELEVRARRFFDEVLRRGNLFLRSRNMNQALLDLFLGLAIMLRVTRYRAAASGRTAPDLSDLGEGISYAECLVLFHVSRQPPPQVVEFIMALLSDNRQGLIGLATAER